MICKITAISRLMVLLIITDTRTGNLLTRLQLSFWVTKRDMAEPRTIWGNWAEYPNVSGNQNWKKKPHSSSILHTQYNNEIWPMISTMKLVHKRAFWLFYDGATRSKISVTWTQPFQETSMMTQQKTLHFSDNIKCTRTNKNLVTTWPWICPGLSW